MGIDSWAALMTSRVNVPCIIRPDLIQVKRVDYPAEYMPRSFELLMKMLFSGTIGNLLCRAEKFLKKPCAAYAIYRHQSGLMRRLESYRVHRN
jgi:hypothetical protein